MLPVKGKMVYYHKILMKFHNCILSGTASIPRLGFHFMQCSNNKWGVSHRRFLCCTIAVVQRVFINSKGILLPFFQGPALQMLTDKWQTN